ncbi:hypothetical protein EXIGLDRAFT_718274 [Exidia glandulosa HHB12029]|uniref:Glutamine amidotransferase type-2 domain-containing protein n=1 Tax=Exidia glandulosa HHB12029 TaxID=1314781 RepID=A0A165HUU6_EXIGL|nr:hypothetical protein EXIGLDRAFT_718274 [Exidia glandulosa HHB12029]
MCGITVLLSRPADSELQEPGSVGAIWRNLVAQNAARGPDLQNTHTVTLKSGLVLSLSASVLHMRGLHPQKQPHVLDGNVLCWNGEIFEGIEISPDANDGAILFSALAAATSPSAVVEVLSHLEGPYAFVFYSATENALYFARDPLGRRSLLLQPPSPEFPALLLSSTSGGQTATPNVEELSTAHILRLDLDALHDCLHLPDSAMAKLSRVGATPQAFSSPPLVNSQVAPEEEPLCVNVPPSAEFREAIAQTIACLDRSVRLRVQHIPPLPPAMIGTNAQDPDVPPARVAVLFSGGIDSTTLALLTDRHIPQDEPIDLLNVAFENPRKLKVQQNLEHPKRKGKGKPKASRGDENRAEPTYMVPDRVTGLEELEELRALCPHRRWNFVEVNITYEESTRMKPVITGLMHPSQTAMDLSLAMALYFATRGIGVVRTADGTAQPYHSHARVVISGLGSDELLGGYSRHRLAFQNGGWQGLIDELQLEISRIPTRNMGRDDRMISSHGKESRYPFLSLSVVSFLASLPVHVKVDPRLGNGEGDKMLLRAVARELGLTLASRRKKRAMQFGSHSARMEDGAPNHGDDVIR